MTAIAANQPWPAGCVGWRQVGWDGVLAEIGNEERFPADSTYVLLERVEHIEFVTKADATAKGLFGQNWASGRLFNATWELHWEKHTNSFLLRLLTEGPLPEGWEWEEFETQAESRLLLFGERKRESDPGWREARIPRWLEYPVEKMLGRVRFIAVPYLREGMVVRMRLKGVVANGRTSTFAT
jgi:hypothetical protein